MITNSPVAPAPAGREFAPMMPESVRVALRSSPAALALWAEAQSHGRNYRFGDRESWARVMGWSVHRVRQAIRALRAAGLYIVEKVRNADGTFATFCQFLASPRRTSSQVAPEVDLPEVDHPAVIPALTGKRKIEEAHTVETCRRNRDGLPCSACAAVKRKAADRTPLGVPIQPPEWRRSPLVGDECEHGVARGAWIRRAFGTPACPLCRLRHSTTGPDTAARVSS